LRVALEQPVRASVNSGTGLPRAIEIPIAALGLAASLPVLAVAALAIRLTSGAPILFRQTRVGRGGQGFELVKLRTMETRAGGAEVTAGDDPRITPVGAWLRRSKLDELPQFWNVLRGDMGLVGPRPETPRYVDLQDPRWVRVLSARPGLTDPASIRYRDEERLMASVPGDRDRYYRDVLLPAKLEVSQAYLSRRTWRSDVAILFRTLARVVGFGGGRREEEASVAADD
jgi:lipopolysaccharide/colanic/teichoic acid biosynthesis glycosyltransferase